METLQVERERGIEVKGRTTSGKRKEVKGGGGSQKKSKGRAGREVRLERKR